VCHLATEQQFQHSRPPQLCRYLRPRQPFVIPQLLVAPTLQQRTHTLHMPTTARYMERRPTLRIAEVNEAAAIAICPSGTAPQQQQLDPSLITGGGSSV
jgi:hypothetical protein